MKMGTMDGMPLSTSEVEVMAKPTRRRFTAEYKQRVLREADRCRGPGETGALLRREGLYSSNLTAWRKQREKGELEGLSQKRRGPLRKENNPLADKVKALERENTRLRARAERAEGYEELGQEVSAITQRMHGATGNTDAWLFNWHAKDWQWDEGKSTYVRGRYFISGPAIDALRSAFSIGKSEG